MTIQVQVIAYLKQCGEVTTVQAEAAIPAGSGAVYKVLRRLALVGKVKKRLSEKHHARSRTAYWQLSRRVE